MEKREEIVILKGFSYGFEYLVILIRFKYQRKG
jgi:hypothetical protein